MGVFPTAPVPGNDHAIVPSPWADRRYLEYGPLLDAIRGRKWVLAPHAVSVEEGAKANLFRVDGGYAVPVVFGGTREKVRVELRGLEYGDYLAEAIHPGSRKPVPIALTRDKDAVVLEAPLVRGCAVIQLRRPE